jgi:hypothetical protein
MRDDKQLPQGSARRSASTAIPLRWQRSQKLAGYYDAERHALIFQDSRGQEIDRIDLPALRIRLTKGVQ